MGTYDPLCDLNGDGQVGLADVSIYSTNHNKTCPTAVSVAPGVGIATLALRPAAPNPMAGSTMLAFELPARAEVRLEIFDLLGRRVRTLAQGLPLEAGAHRLAWDGRDDSGRPANQGVYRCRLEAGGEWRATSLVLLR